MHRAPRFLFAAVLVGTVACSINPATGRMQAFLIDEKQEVEIGRKSDEEILSSMRTYAEAPTLVAKVEEVGAKAATFV